MAASAVRRAFQYRESAAILREIRAGGSARGLQRFGARAVRKIQRTRPSSRRGQVDSTDDPNCVSGPDAIRGRHATKALPARALRARETSARAVRYAGHEKFSVQRIARISDRQTRGFHAGVSGLHRSGGSQRLSGALETAARDPRIDKCTKPRPAIRQDDGKTPPARTYGRFGKR